MEDLYAPYEDPAIQQAQTGYETAANTATQYQSAADVLPDLLKTAINEKLDYNKDLIAEKNKSMVDYFNAPSQARVQYQDIFNPFQREALVKQATNNAYLPFATNQEVLKMRTGSLADIINAATGTFGAKVKSLQGAADTAKDKLAYLFQLAGAKSDALYKKASLAQSAGGGNTATGRASAAMEQVAKDARDGKTLREIMQTYGTNAYITPDEILRIYNTNSPYGPAKESSSLLQSLYGVKPIETAEQRNRAAALSPAQTAIDQVRSLNIDQTGPQNKVSKYIIDNWGGIGIPQNIVSLNQNFELLKQNVVRALQGARMSDQDIEIAKGYIPTIIDTPDTVRTKLDNLQKFLDSLTDGGGSSSTETWSFTGNTK